MALLAVAVLSSLASHVDLFGSECNRGVRLLLTAATVAVTALALALMMSLASLERHGLSIILPDTITVAALWQLLQIVGGAYVSGVLSQVNQTALPDQPDDQAHRGRRNRDGGV